MGKGLILGKTPTPKRGLLSAVRDLFDMRVSSSAACEHFMGMTAPEKLVRINTDTTPHVAVFSRTGGSKGVGCIQPYLLNSDETAVVVDTKGGENARLTAE